MDSFVLTGLGNILAEEGDYDGAIAYYSDAIRFDPKNTVAAQNRDIAIKARGQKPGGGLIIGGSPRR